MNVNKLIMDTLQPLIPNTNATVKTVAFNVYSGTETTYVTFNYADERAISFIDNEPTEEKHSMQIHLFTKLNYMTLKKQIRSALRKAGFSHPTITALHENDTKIHHIIFECEIVGIYESEE